MPATVLRTPLGSDPVTLDPQLIFDSFSDAVARQVYEGLVTFDPDSLTIQPLLAESWDVLDSGRVYRFQLRRGVRFHDDPCFVGGVGREVLAEDVRYSWDRIMRAKEGHPIGWQFIIQVAGYFPNEGRVVPPVGIRVLGKYRLEVRLKTPVAFFPSTTFMMYAAIVPREAVEYYGEDFAYHPVGTGPFQFQSWERNAKIVLVRNPHYWQQDSQGKSLPYLGRVEFMIHKDPLVQWAEFKAGRLDVTPVPPDILTTVLPMADGDEPRQGTFRLIQQKQSLRTRFIEFEFPSDTLLPSHRVIQENQRLRQALNYAVDREGLIATFFPGGQAIPAKGKLPPSPTRHSMNGAGYHYDLNRAQELLREAGYPGGKGLPELVLRVPSPARNLGIARWIQNDWAQIGIPLKLLTSPEHLTPSRAASLVSNMRLAGWGADYPDLFSFLAGVGRNRIFSDSLSRYFTAWEERLRGIIDDSLRYVQYYAFDQESARWAYEVFLYHRNPQVYAVQPAIYNYEISPLGDAVLKTVYKLEKESP